VSFLFILCTDFVLIEMCQSKSLFFLNLDTVAFLFVFNNYCSIME